LQRSLQRALNRSRFSLHLRQHVRIELLWNTSGRLAFRFR
jgi:hypothetical protein